MANNLNQCTFVGHLGQDIEVRQTQNGKSIGNFSIGVNKQWKDQSGQKQERATWPRVVLMGNIVDAIAPYLTKGTKVLVQGEYQVRQWQDQQGNDRYNHEFVVGMNGKIELLDGKPRQGQAQQQFQNQQAPQTQQKPSNDFEDDIPF